MRHCPFLKQEDKSLNYVILYINLISVPDTVDCQPSIHPPFSQKILDLCSYPPLLPQLYTQDKLTCTSAPRVFTFPLLIIGTIMASIPVNKKWGEAS